MLLATAEQMQNLDEAAIDRFGIPGIVLMENAGRATVEIIGNRFGELAGQKFAVFAGPGNNGGDGFVIARHLHQHGGMVTVYLLGKGGNLQGDAATNLAVVLRLPIPVVEILDDEALQTVVPQFEDNFLLVDALFGTGLSREVLGFPGALISSINRCSRPVVAVDIPSGLNADTGMPLGECIKADLTVTYGLGKPGQILYPGRQLTGDLEVVDIGFPLEAQAEVGELVVLLEEEAMGRLIPRRLPDAHKGTFGHLLVLAGSKGKTGAALLTAQGALRCGTGLVSLVVPSDLNPIFETALPEAMTFPMEESADGHLSVSSIAAVHAALNGMKALVIGPGLGTATETTDLVATLYRDVELPMVVDADGLNCLLGHLTLLRQAPAARILTPHPGEMARLLDKSIKEVQADRLAAARDFAKEHNVVLVLKGAASVIAAPNGKTALCPTGNAGMAAGGMGDVLSGLIGGLLAQGCEPFEAACLGVFVHGLAADRLAENMEVCCGYLASEVADTVPCVLTKLAKG